MAVRMNHESGGFKLLEEDPLDDRPCPAVKKFVSSVLDRKDMKDQEVANSFRNLMEYRDSVSSPSACSVATSSSVLDGDRLNSPPSPSSPTTVPGPMDDQRLPNELLDEICEDIGMKEGMELDFVEYLMEQDTNPHLYMTQEAISSGAFNSVSGSTISTPTGSASGSSNSGSASGSHGSNSSINHSNTDKTLTVLTPPVTTTPNFLFKQNFADSDWAHQLPPAVVHPSSDHSSGSTTVQSSENNSPANKRAHLSASTDTSPNKGRSQTPPGFHQHGRPGSNTHGLFKMPQPGPPVARRSHSYPQGAPTSSPVQSTNSSNSSQGSHTSSRSNNHVDFSRPQEFAANPPSSCQPSDSSDQEEPTLTNNSKKSQCISPKPALPPSGMSYDFHQPGSPRVHGQFNPLPGCVGGRDGSVFQRVGKQPPPPNINVKSMQQQQQQHHHHHQQQQQQPNMHQRWAGQPMSQVNHSSPGPFFGKGMYPGVPYQPQHPHPHHGMMGQGHHIGGHMPVPTRPHNPTIRTPVDSPLDQGYFSNESAGNCSNGSAPSPAFTSSSMSSFSSVTTMMPADHHQNFSQKSSIVQPQQASGLPGIRPPGQKSVHFADMPDSSPPGYSQSPGNVSVEMKQQPFAPGSSSAPDCAFEMESNGQPKMPPSGKIMPRYSHNMKSGVAPYTVPNSQGQVMGPSVSPGFEVNSRSSCAMNAAGDRSTPGEPMHEYMSKPAHMNGNIAGSAFYMDGNQNMMRIDSMQDYPPLVPPPLISPQSGDYIGMQQDHSRYGMVQYSSMQQQQVPHSQQQQSSSSSSATESMPPLHPQTHMQPHQFSSCSHPSQGMGPEFVPPHQNNMQISNNGGGPSGYHVPVGMSGRAAQNTRPGGGYAGQMCSYENSYEQGGHPALYPAQQTHGPPTSNQGMMQSQQGPSVMRGWGGPEDLRVQVGGMHSDLSPMKGGLQAPHSQGSSQMLPSPTPACAAPMGLGPHMQEMSGMNTGMHSIPPHPHMGGPHPEYGPCSGISCNACKMPQTGNPPHLHHHMGPCPGPGCQMCKLNHPSVGGSAPPNSLPHAGPCAGPGCTACKINQASRPHMLSSQQKFIQHLIMDEGNSAYRSHPLFPLLRDLVIAEMNFDNPRFHYQQLLSLLPNDFHKLLQNFLHRNPPTGHYQTNQALESVIMDSLRLAHSNLVDKIRHRQEMEKVKANSSASLRSMEEFCQKFDHSVTAPMGRPGPNGSMNLVPIDGYHEGSYMQHSVGHMYRSMKDGPDMYIDNSLAVSSPQTNKTESKKHPSLPKEAVAMMMEWLRSHKDNPYPNDDEKAMLIKQTGLSINQINYWFTNARRRILPKWAQCKT